MTNTSLRNRAQLHRIDPIKALYWSAVVNGVLAAPVMVLLMMLVRRPKVMFVTGPMCWLGWAATAAMGLCIVGMAATKFMGRGPRT